MTIAEFRRRSGLTQGQLASLVGVAPNTVARWERGEIQPSSTAREKLRRVMAGALAPLRGLRRAARRMNPDGEEPFDPTGALPALAAAAEGVGWPLVLIGGLAVVAHGVRRLTDDADVIGPPVELLDAYLRFGSVAGLRFVDLGPVPGSQWQRAALTAAGVRVEAILADDEFLRNAALRAVKIVGSPARVLSVEDLILMKMLAGRPKDDLDVGSLMKLHAEKLDLRYVSRWAKRLRVSEKWRDARADYAAGLGGW